MAPATIIDARSDCATGYQRLRQSPACALVLVDDTGGLIGLVGERELLHHFSGRAMTRSSTALESSDISLRKALNEVRHSDRVLDSVMFSVCPICFFSGCAATARSSTIGHEPTTTCTYHPEYFLEAHAGWLPEVIAQQFVGKLAQVVDTGQMRCFDYSLDVAGETRRFEARLCRFDDNAKVISVVRDITRQLPRQRRPCTTVKPA